MDGGTTARQSVLTDSDVERVVQRLRDIDHDSAWTRILEVGRVVFEGLGAGNEAHWRSHRSTKHMSLRRLVEHPACPFKKTALGAAVNVYLFVKRNPSVVSLAVSPTHVMRVVGLANDESLELLQRADEYRWTVREIGLKAQACREHAGERRGRPISPAERKAETLARRAVAALRAMHEQLARCETLDSGQSSALLVALDEVLELAATARRLPVADRKSGVVLSLAKATKARDDRAEVAG